MRTNPTALAGRAASWFGSFDAGFGVLEYRNVRVPEVLDLAGGCRRQLAVA